MESQYCIVMVDWLKSQKKILTQPLYQNKSPRWPCCCFMFSNSKPQVRSRVGIDNPSYKETDDVCVLKHPVTSLPPSLIWLHLEYSTMPQRPSQQAITTTQQSHTLVICEAGHSMTLRRLKMPKMHRASYRIHTSRVLLADLQRQKGKQGIVNI